MRTGLGKVLPAAAVALAGTVGFVGLIVPHVLRLLFGPSHRRLLISSALGGALFLAWQGVPQTLGAPIAAATLEGAKQTIALGPVASQEAIKLLSGDGGGFALDETERPPNGAVRTG